MCDEPILVWDSLSLVFIWSITKFSKSRDEIPSDLVNQSLELQRKVLNQSDQDLLDLLEVQIEHLNYASGHTY
jgi:hypothetical protein